MSEHDVSENRFVWLRSGFDLEGYVGALAAILIGLLLSMFWGPLFLLGLAGAVVALLGTRTAERTPPLGDDLIVAPTDGIVVSVQPADPPMELRLPGGSWQRLRIAVAPSHSNGVHAAMDGAVGHIIRETGDPAAFAALKPERPGLAVLFFTLLSGDRNVGIRLATGGLGPRLEMDSESGDAVRLGRVIGTLRLGGWCDVFLPADIAIVPRPGQTLIGSETILGHWDETATDDTTTAPTASATPPASAAVADAAVADAEDSAPEAPAPSETPATDDMQDDDPLEAAKDLADKAESLDDEDALTLEKIAGAIAENADADEASDGDDEDVSEMFERLRRGVRKTDDDPD